MAQNGAFFHEVQRLPLRRMALMLAIPPSGMSLLLLWQVVLGHPWGQHPMTNTSVIGWTTFLWLVYVRLLTVRLVTEVRDRELVVTMRGLWRAHRVPLANIASAEAVDFDPIRDYGGYGIRSNREGKAYIANGNGGVRVKLSDGSNLVVGSQRANALASVLKPR
jgi:hypothetical protein